MTFRLYDEYENYEVLGREWDRNGTAEMFVVPRALVTRSTEPRNRSDAREPTSNEEQTGLSA
jgi:hypothetical protein